MYWINYYLFWYWKYPFDIYAYSKIKAFYWDFFAWLKQNLAKYTSSLRSSDKSCCLHVMTKLCEINNECVARTKWPNFYTPKYCKWNIHYNPITLNILCFSAQKLFDTGKYKMKQKILRILSLLLVILRAPACNF